MDRWAIRYWLYRVTTALHKVVTSTCIYVVGSGGRDAVEEFCRHHKYTWSQIPYPDPKLIPRAVQSHKEIYDPDVLLAFTKGGETVWEYATLAIEQGIKTILTAQLAGEDDN
jgi:hypothetical protein